jgi:ATP:corrinoid adenosyltransferase
VSKNTAEEFANELKALAECLNRCEHVTRYDTEAEKQAWTLAHSLLDLAKSFRTILDEQLPQLRDEALSCEEIHDVLLEIGEEFRHILYHVRDPEFYAYLCDDVTAAPDGGETR